MFRDYFEDLDDAPPDIAWFEWLWLSTLALTAIITIMMFDWSMNRVGPTVLRYSPACALADPFC